MVLGPTNFFPNVSSATAIYEVWPHYFFCGDWNNVEVIILGPDSAICWSGFMTNPMVDTLKNQLSKSWFIQKRNIQGTETHHYKWAPKWSNIFVYLAGKVDIQANESLQQSSFCTDTYKHIWNILDSKRRKTITNLWISIPHEYLVTLVIPAACATLRANFR